MYFSFRDSAGDRFRILVTRFVETWIGRHREGERESRSGSRAGGMFSNRAQGVTAPFYKIFTTPQPLECLYSLASRVKASRTIWVSRKQQPIQLIAIRIRILKLTLFASAPRWTRTVWF